MGFICEKDTKNKNEIRNKLGGDHDTLSIKWNVPFEIS